MSNGRRGSRMIHLLPPCPSRRGASGVYLRRILTGCGREGLAHLILRSRFADGGARTGVRRSTRMGLVGCGGMPKIATREQGLFLVKRSSDRDFLSALVTLGTPRHDRMIAPISSRSIHTDLLVCAPRPYTGHTGLVSPLESCKGILSARCRKRPPHHFPLASGITHPIPDPELHGKDTSCLGPPGGAAYRGAGAGLAWPWPSARAGVLPFSVTRRV